MFERQRTGAILCPSCGQLVGVNDAKCLGCGRRNPGLWGFASLLRSLGGDDMAFVNLVLWACGALYLCTLVVDPEGIRMQGLFSLLAPGQRSLVLFGASGAVPVFRLGRWWTVLSAAWLHGSLLHIVFNMMWVRDLGPVTAHVYGVSRTIIIYTVSAITGFLASSLAGRYLFFLPGFLRGAGLTVGASAPIFGLLGALLYYGRRGGSSLVGGQAKSWAITLFLFGFIFPGVDNWAHLGGFAGGYLTSRFLDPLRPERLDHLLIALFCLGLSVASVVASVAHGQFLR